MANETKRERNTAEQQAQAADAAGNLVVDVIMGPYRGQRLTMPESEAAAAVSAHWARDPFSGEPYGTAHDPLSDEERETALEAADTWARTQWGQPVATEQPTEGDVAPTRARSMQADKPGGYATRAAPTPTPAPKP